MAELQRAGIMEVGPALLPYRDAVCAVRAGSATAAMAAEGPGAASSEGGGSAEDLSRWGDPTNPFTGRRLCMLAGWQCSLQPGRPK